jgi:SNF2 family DNA or RNA helicase
MPLHSGVYEQVNRPISVMIVDEAQKAKNPDSLLACALRSIPATTTLCLSGTLVHNSWTDLYSVVSLLPGCPFVSLEHFKSLFGVTDASGRLRPDEPRMALLQRFMASISIIRPKEVLTLPPIHFKEVKFTIDDPVALHHIREAVSIGKMFLSKAGRKKKKAAFYINKAFKAFHKAGCFSLSPLIYREPIPVTTDDADSAQADAEQEGHPRDDPEDTDESEEEAETIPLRVLARHAMKRNAERAERPGDIPDDPEIGNVVNDDPATLPEESDDEFVKQLSRSNAAFAATWRSELSMKTDAEIFAPRVRAICQKLFKVLSKYGGEKVIIASSVLMFLDVINEAISREFRLRENMHDVRVREFNGTMDSEARQRVLADFNNPLSTCRVLLLSITAGGTGLNITGGSRLIICEPQWSPGLEEQLIGRAHRMPQDKHVHAYRVWAENSDLDITIREQLKDKVKIKEDLMSGLRRRDEDKFVIPRLPTEAELV